MRFIETILLGILGLVSVSAQQPKHPPRVHHQQAQKTQQFRPKNHNENRHRPPGGVHTQPSEGPRTLRCEEHLGPSYQINDRINVTVMSISKFGLKPDCPCPTDKTGKCRTAPHMCVASNVTYVCTFYMRDMTITALGGLVEGTSRDIVSFGHHTMSGGKDPQYFPMISQIFLKGFDNAMSRYVQEVHPMTRDIVVPLRSRWDDCFNHLSFQSMPLMALMYEFHPELWDKVNFHASRFTAALLMLLDVPQSSIVVEKNVRAKTVLMPWTPYWNPVQLATLKGVARRMSAKFTANLLEKKFSREERSTVKPLIPQDYDYRPLNLSMIVNDQTVERFVVYLNRSKDGSRTVFNEPEILKLLKEQLKPQYKLVVLGPTKEYKSIEQLHVIWQQYAEVVNRAVLLIGPHGGGMNNMIWAPDDCDLIEFNEFPDDEHYMQSHGETPVRTVFLTGYFAKQGPNATYWNLPAVLKHPQNFYEGKMRIAPRDLMQTMSLVKNGKLIKDKNMWKNLAEEKVGSFSKG